MTLKDIDVDSSADKVKALLEKEKGLSPALIAAIEMLLLIVILLCNRLGLNSSNSSKPPSSDPNRKKGSNRKKSTNKPGGQKGHKGTTLEPVSDPDNIKNLSIDKRKLPRGKKYTPDGYLARQVINIKISRIVTEYRAEILVDEKGNQYMADFPSHITRPIQYGASIKATTTYASTYQLIPYERIQEQLKDEYGIPISTGSIYNFNAEAAGNLTRLGFDAVVKQQLINSFVAHADETGININGTKIWLHNLSNENWTWFEPHVKRGCEAMNDIGLIPYFSGVLCHDHWKPYYTYECDHSLCNAHHIRELTRAYEQDGQQWAENMRVFLLALNDEVNAMKKGALSKKKARVRRDEYRAILAKGDSECPAAKPKSGKRGKTKQSKARNLLDRLIDFENDTLRFMIDPLVPFTNNLGERDIRMTKVQQKISGCFRSMEGAKNFSIVRSYLSTCKKNGISGYDALEMIFNDRLPSFIQEKVNSDLSS